MEATLKEQLTLFSEDRLPRRPYCSDDPKRYGLQIRPLATAIKRPYIQFNAPHLRAWMLFDIDREGGALAWESAGLPPPAWAAANRENGHAHVGYCLTAPVLVGDHARRAPMRLLQSIESAYREAMQADRGYSGLIAKNPKHERWRVLHGPQVVWELGELAEYCGDLKKHVPRHCAPELYGLGRNVSLFDHLRQWAYRRIRNAKGGQTLAEWRLSLSMEAMLRNGEFAYPLDDREVAHLVKSVASWTWNKFNIAESDARFAKTQSERGKRSGRARIQASENNRASARLMRAKGIPVKAIAAELEVSERTVWRWLDDEQSCKSANVT